MNDENATLWNITFQKQYKIEGRPVPLMRPRFTSKGSKRAYDAQVEIKERYTWEVKYQHVHENYVLPPFSGKLLLKVVFSFKYPKSWPKKRKHEQLHAGRPDISNLIKFLEDVSQGSLFLDDAQIAVISARKIYSDEDYTLFTIGVINEET